MKKFILVSALIICIGRVLAQTSTSPFPMLSTYGDDPNFNEVFFDVNEWIRANPLNTEYESEIKFHSRAQYFMEPRLDQTGSMKSYIDNYYDFIRSRYEIICGESFIESDWNCIGPHTDPVGSDQFLGYLQTLWVDPGDENHILVGNNGGGIWESKGTYTSPNEWKYITDNPGFPGMGIRKIAVDPFDNNIIYASTYLRQVLVYQRNYGVGVMYSEDAGESWLIDEEFLNFISDPPSPILTDVPLYLPYTYNIKYLPKFGGGYDLYLPYFNFLLKKNFVTEQWEPISSATLAIDAIYRDIESVPGNPNFMIATYSYPSGGSLYSNVQYTTNGGSTWGTLSFMIGAENVFVSIPNNETIIVMYEYAGLGGKEHDIYVYDITGASPVLSTSFTSTISKCIYCKLWIEKMIVSPSNINIIYLADRQGVVLKSIDGGYNFFEISTYTGDLHTDIRDLVLYKATTDAAGDNPGNILTGDHDILFAATDGGLGKSNDGGATWVSQNKTGLNINNGIGFANSELDKNRILVTAGDGNGFINRETGWSHGPQLDGGQADISNVDQNKGVYEGTLPSSRYFNKITINPIGGYSSIFGAPTVPLFTGYTYSDYVNTDKKPFQYQDGSDDFWTGTTDIFSIANTFPNLGGIYSWNQQSTLWYLDPLALELLKLNQPIASIEIVPDPYNPTQEYKYVAVKGFIGTLTPPDIADVNDHKILRFDPNDISEPWKNITPYSDNDVYPSGDFSSWSAFNEGWIADFAVDPNNPSEIWAGFTKSWYIEGPTQWRVMYSPDAGETWYDRSEGLPDFPINCLVYWKGSNDVLFAGTDVGVYVFHRDPLGVNGEGTWECFNEGMPIAFISDLEIVYCTNTLRACTNGLSVWETELPFLNEVFLDTYTPIEISSEITWDESIDAFTDIVIKPGAKLTIINCEIRMPRNGKIIVENGGALIIDGAIITNHCESWRGIEVWGKGNSTSHPTVGAIYGGTYPSSSNDHGVVYLKNGAMIENAQVGITTSNSGNYSNNAYYGGIIVAHDAIFQNNLVSIEMMPFDFAPINTNDDNISEFHQVNFIKNSDLPCESICPADVFLTDVDGVRFLSCNFENTFVNCIDVNYPVAIKSANATFSVLSDLCLPAEIGCVESRTTFSGYYRAIWAANSAYRPMEIKIEGSDFVNNERGVLFSAIANSKIWRNNFEIPDYESKTCYGLYLESCSNYHVEENYFTTSSPSFTSNSNYCSGILVQNNSNTATEIYRNKFENIEIGVRCQGNNSKLQIRCNEFVAPIPNYNIIVTSGGSGDFGNQGICNASLTQPAGNTFSSDGSGMKHFRIVPSGINITYRHHTEAQYIPQFYTTGQINLHNCSVSGSDYCVSTLPGGTGGIERVAENDLVDYDSLINVELNMIDNGNTSTLINGMNSQDPYTEEALFDYSPYLSDTVLITLITSNLLSNSSLIEILELNKPLSDNVYQVLSQNNVEIPPGLIGNLTNDVIDGDYIISHVENIYANVDLLNWNGLRVNDSIVDRKLQEGEIEEAINFIDEIEGPNSDSKLIELFAVTGDHNASQSLLDSIEVNGDLAFVTLYSIYNEVESEGSEVDSISNQKVEELIGVQSKNTIAGVAVQNLLNQINSSYSYPEIIDPIPDIFLKEDYQIIEGEVALKVFPVPADNILFMELTTSAEVNGKLELISLGGNVIARKDLNNINSCQVLWLDISAVSQGIYYLRILDDKSQVVAIGKVIIQR